MHFTILTMSVFAGLALAEGPGVCFYSTVLGWHTNGNRPYTIRKIFLRCSTTEYAILFPGVLDELTYVTRIGR